MKNGFDEHQPNKEDDVTKKRKGIQIIITNDDDESESPESPLYEKYNPRRLNTQSIIRRNKSLSIFTLTSSEQKKIDYLNKIYKEQEDKEEKEAVKLKAPNTASLPRNSKKNSLQVCFTTNTFETYYQHRPYGVLGPRLSTVHLNKKLNKLASDNDKELAYLSLFSFSFLNKRNSTRKHLKKISKIYLFILLLTSIIFISIFYSFLKLVNKT